jgi:hypothetical protein
MRNTCSRMLLPAGEHRSREKNVDPVKETLRKQIRLEGVRFIAAVLLLSLAACAPAANRLETSDLRTATVIRDFKPDKGESARYNVGAQVSFTYNLERAGFITLVAYDDDGRTYDIERSVNTRAGTQTLPRAEDTTSTGGKAAYIVDPPTGPQRVFLIYTDRASPATSRISGNFKAADLSKVIRAYINASGATVYDVAETRFEVVQ